MIQSASVSEKLLYMFLILKLEYVGRRQDLGPEIRKKWSEKLPLSKVYYPDWPLRHWFLQPGIHALLKWKISHQVAPSGARIPVFSNFSDPTINCHFKTTLGHIEFKESLLDIYSGIIQIRNIFLESKWTDSVDTENDEWFLYPWSTSSSCSVSIPKHSTPPLGTTKVKSWSVYVWILLFLISLK